MQLNPPELLQSNGHEPDQLQIYVERPALPSRRHLHVPPVDVLLPYFTGGGCLTPSGFASPE